MASLPWGDLSKLTVENLHFAIPTLKFFLFDSSPCSVTVLDTFLMVGKQRTKSRFFRWINTRKGIELRKQCMSYSQAKEVIKKRLQC